MKYILVLVLFLSACATEPKTNEQPCKWLLDEKTQEYVAVCK